jgi:hypothetical protein
MFGTKEIAVRPDILGLRALSICEHADIRRTFPHLRPKPLGSICELSTMQIQLTFISRAFNGRLCEAIRKEFNPEVESQ